MTSEMQLFEAALYAQHAVNQKQLYFYDFLTKRSKTNLKLHRHINKLACIDINISVDVVLTAQRVICSLTRCWLAA